MDNDELMKKMDEAGEEARKDFYELPIEARKIISSWVLKWYLKAGFKRLGRIMVGFEKEMIKLNKIS